MLPSYHLQFYISSIPGEIHVPKDFTYLKILFSSASSFAQSSQNRLIYAEKPQQLRDMHIPLGDKSMNYINKFKKFLLRSTNAC